MNSLFNDRNPLYRILDKIGSLMILNLCFIIGSIPIITIGTSLSALYYSSFKLLKEDNPSLIKDFIHAYKLNFKQCTIATIIFIFMAVVAYAWMLVINLFNNQIIIITIQIFVYIFIFSLALIVLYFFPLCARFNNTFLQACKNASLMSIRHLHYTLLIFIIHAILLLVSYFEPVLVGYGLLWILFGFSLIAYLSAYFFDKIFRQYETN